jgi:FkbM family methyltransferase
MLLRTALRRLALRYTGYDIHKYNPERDLDYFADIAEILSKRDSITAFDVGANVGQTVRKLVQVLPRVSIHAFEPSPSTFAELSQALVGYSAVTLNNCGVGSQKSAMDLIENTRSYMTSFLEMGPRGWGEVVQRIKVPVTTVDDYSAQRSIQHIHLLKIDTQGFDFEVIKGADRMLAEGRVDLVLTEITFARLYEGLPRLDAIYAHMAEHGYRLTGVYDQQRSGRILNWADVMFASESILRERAGL